MAGNALRQDELPPPVREIMRHSIEQAKRAFDAFVAANEQSWATVRLDDEDDAANLRALNRKISEITRVNADAHFALAYGLSDARDMGHAIELQNAHTREQMESFPRQLAEVRDLALRLIADTRPKD